MNPEEPPHVLYRFYTKTGQLLYVGITMNPPQRFKSHQNGKEWWSEVSGITVEHYESRLELQSAERRAIQVEKPRYNVVHNSGRIETQCRDCRSCDHASDDPRCYVFVTKQIYVVWKQLAQAFNETFSNVVSTDSKGYFFVDPTKAVVQAQSKLFGNLDQFKEVAEDLIALESYRRSLVDGL
jgi:predicted GIY-YIG superfamily endonuclease